MILKRENAFWMKMHADGDFGKASLTKKRSDGLVGGNCSNIMNILNTSS